MEHVREKLSVSERRACRVLGQARSTQRRSAQVPDDEARLVARVTELARRVRTVRLPEDNGSVAKEKAGE